MLNYSEQGKGLPVVLLHGFPLDRRIWRAQLDGLSSICRVITPDLLGFGQSISTAPFTIASQADAVHALLQHIGALPCILGGLSMGGYVTLAFAKKYPSDLRALILADTRAEADTPQAIQARQAMIDLAAAKGSPAIADQMMPKMIADQSVEPQVRQIMEDCPPLTIQHALAALRDRDDSTGFLPKIKVPTLVLVGELDAITPPALSESMAKSIPNAKLEIIAGAGHMSPMERPREVTAAIRTFLESQKK